MSEEVVKKERWNPIKSLWNTLEKKGRWTTLMSLVIAFPINTSAIYFYFKNPDWFTEQRLVTLAVLNGLAWFWCIMPSKINISGPKFTVEVED